MSTGRLEAFSDGVIAVAITLLVLNLSVPGAPDLHLARDLGREWPRYAAYVVSFVTIGIVWINHHSMVSRLEHGDHTVLMLNLVLLLTIGALPFATNLMATYLNETHGQHLAAAVYSGAFLAMALAFSALNAAILLRKPQLLVERLDERERRRVFIRAVTGVVPYVVALALAPVSAYVSLAICGAIALYYALPIASGR